MAQGKIDYRIEREARAVYVVRVCRVARNEISMLKESGVGPPQSKTRSAVGEALEVAKLLECAARSALGVGDEGNAEVLVDIQ